MPKIIPTNKDLPNRTGEYEEYVEQAELVWLKLERIKKKKNLPSGKYMAVRIKGQKSLSTDTITHSFRNMVLQIDHLRRGRTIRRSEIQEKDIIWRTVKA